MLPSILGFIGAFVIMPLVGAVIVWMSAHYIRYRFPSFGLAASLLLSHTLLILLCIAIAPTGLLIPDIPFDDLYLAYYLVPGTHIYFSIIQLVVEPLTPLAFRLMSPHTASIALIIFVPCLAGLLVGGLQWYLLGRVCERINVCRMKKA